MPLGFTSGRPFTPLSVATSARNSAIACFRAAFSASSRSARASSSPRDRPERGSISEADMVRTGRVWTGPLQPPQLTSARLFAPRTPAPGRALAYVDFSSQEMGIAAALSGDPALLEAYQSGDVYLSFAKQAGLAPLEATKASHGEVRDRCKAAVLGTLFGMGPETLARRIGRPLIEARELLRLHQATYRRFWEWSDHTTASAVLGGSISTVFGWRLRVGAEFNPRSLMNFPMQSHGAE